MKIFSLLSVCIIFIAGGCASAGKQFFQEGKNAYYKFDAGKSAMLYKQACDNNYAQGCYKLGAAYAYRIGVKQDYIKAFPLLEKGCMAREFSSCFTLGQMYGKGSGVAKDAGKTTPLWNKAENIAKKECGKGEAEACQFLAYIYSLDIEKYSPAKAAEYAIKTKNLFLKECDKGLYHSCYYLGVAYTNNTMGLKQDFAKALEFMQKACGGGYAESCLQLGAIYEGRLGAAFIFIEDKNEKKAQELFAEAFKLYKKDCEDGVGHACFRLADDMRLYVNEPAPGDTEIKELYEKACDNYYGEACYKLGLIYSDKEGDKASKARELYEKAYELGYERACVEIGRCIKECGE